MDACRMGVIFFQVYFKILEIKLHQDCSKFLHT